MTAIPAYYLPQSVYTASVSDAMSPIAPFRPSLTSPLQGRAALLSPWEDPLVCIFGGAWVFLILDSFFKLISSCWAYAEAPAQESLERRSVIDLTVFGGTVANSLHWADFVGLISIGPGAELAKALGYGSTSIIALFGVVECLQDLCATSDMQQMALIMLSLGSRVCALAWSVLGIASYMAGMPLIPGITSLLFLSSFLFFLGNIGYRIHLARQERVVHVPQPEPALAT